MLRHFAGAGFFVLFAGLHLAAQIPGGRTLDVRVADALYRADANRIYASLTADSPQYPQAAVEIDPDSLAITRSVVLPTVADTLRISDDGAVLWAITRSAPSRVYHIDLSTMSIDAQFTPLFNDDPPERQRLTDLLPISGHPQSYAASFTDQWANYKGIAAFDGDQRRPRTGGDPPTGAPLRYVSKLVPTGAPDLIYGYNGLTTGFEISRIQIVDDGLQYVSEPIPGMALGFGAPLQVFRGLLYAANGYVSNVETRTAEGWFRDVEFTAASAQAIDGDAGRIYFASRWEWGISYLAYDLNTFLPVARLRLENPAARDFAMPGASRRLLLTAAGDLVTFDDSGKSRLLFIPVSALPAYAPWTPPDSAEQVSSNARLLRIPASYLAADPVNRTLLATIQGRVPGGGNSLVTIEPASGTVLSRVFVGSEPGPPAASPGGVYTYMPLHGHAAVRRVRTSDNQPDLLVHLSNVEYPAGDPVRAAQIVPLPGGDESYAVLQNRDPESDVPWFDALVVYDRDARRPKAVKRSEARINSASIDAGGGRLFGLNWEVSSFEFSRVAITPEGAVFDKKVGLGSNFFETLHCDDTLCATTMGTVIDGNAAVRTARLPAAGLVIPDRGAGRVYLLANVSSRLELREYDADTARLLRSSPLGVAGPAYDFCRWAPGEFAALTKDGVVLFSASALVPIPAPVAAPSSVKGGVTKLGLRVTAAVFDPQRNLIYAAISNYAGAYANEVVAIDPATGGVVKDLPVGSDISILRLTDDGRYLYAGLATGNAVARLDLDGWQRDAVYSVPGSPFVLTLRPGHSDTFFAAVNAGPQVGFGNTFWPPQGFWMYVDGVQQPAGTDATPMYALALDADAVITDNSLLRVGAGGLTKNGPTPPRFIYGAAQAVSNGLAFGGMGSIGNVSTLRLSLQLDEYGLPLPDPDHGRLYYLRREGIRVYDASTFRVAGLLPYEFPNTGDPGVPDMFPCGGDCLAIVVNGALHLADLGAIQWNTAAEKPVDRSGDNIQRLPLHSTALLYDGGRGVLYAATPAEEGPFGNSVLVIDPATGAIINTIAAGASPTSLALSEDGAKLYVGLRGERSVATIDLNAAQVVSRVPLPQPKSEYDDYWPTGVAVLPGTNDVLGVTATDGNTWWNWRQMMLDAGGVMRPQWVGGDPFRYALGDTIFFNSAGTRLQVFGAGMDQQTHSSLPAGASGLQYAAPERGGVERNVAVCGGLVFASSGAIYDRETLADAGSVSLPGPVPSPFEYRAVACDASRDRLYYWRKFDAAEDGRVVHHTVLYSLKLSTKEVIESRELPAREGYVTRMVATGDAGVAFWISTQPSYLGPYAPPPGDDELILVRTP